MENIAEAMLEQGLTTADEIAHIVAEPYALARDGCIVMSPPRIAQAWGVRAPSL
jgi:hypothetical protein